MKKLISFALIPTLFVFLFSAASANAQSDNALQNRNEVQQKVEETQSLIEQKKTELQQRLEEKKASKEAQLTERNRVRVRFYWGRLNTRLEAYINRLNVLIERIDSRINYISENNEDVDTSKIEGTLDNARENLSEASYLLETANANLETYLDQNPPKDAFKLIKDDVSSIKTLLIDTHSLLVHVIGDIKGLRVGVTNVIITPTP